MIVVHQYGRNPEEKASLDFSTLKDLDNLLTAFLTTIGIDNDSYEEFDGNLDVFSEIIADWICNHPNTNVAFSFKNSLSIEKIEPGLLTAIVQSLNVAEWNALSYLVDSKADCHPLSFYETRQFHFFL